MVRLYCIVLCIAGLLVCDQAEAQRGRGRGRGYKREAGPRRSRGPWDKSRAKGKSEKSDPRSRFGKRGFPGKSPKSQGPDIASLEKKLDSLLRELQAVNEQVRQLRKKSSPKKESPKFGSRKPGFPSGPWGRFGRGSWGKVPWGGPSKGKFGKFDPAKMKEWKERFEKMKREAEKEKRKPGSGRPGFPGRGPRGRRGRGRTQDINATLRTVIHREEKGIVDASAE